MARPLTLLRHAAPHLKNDREVVIEALKRSGWALEHASDELRRERDIVLGAVVARGEHPFARRTPLRLRVYLTCQGLRLRPEAGFHSRYLREGGLANVNLVEEALLSRLGTTLPCCLHLLRHPTTPHVNPRCRHHEDCGCVQEARCMGGHGC